MLHAGTTITVYNHAVANHQDVWRRTVIKNCSVRLKTASAVTDSGLKTASAGTVRIPESSPDSAYFPAAEWRSLSAPGSGWTLQKADVILIGEGPPLSGGIAELKQKYGSDSVLVIDGYSDNRRGSPSMRHWRVYAS